MCGMSTSRIPWSLSGTHGFIRAPWIPLLVQLVRSPSAGAHVLGSWSRRKRVIVISTESGDCRFELETLSWRGFSLKTAPPPGGSLGKVKWRLRSQLGAMRDQWGLEQSHMGKIDPLSCLMASIGKRPIQCLNPTQDWCTKQNTFLEVLMYTELSRIRLWINWQQLCSRLHWERLSHPPSPVPYVYRDEPFPFVTSTHVWLSLCLLAESSQGLFIVWHHIFYNFSFISPFNAVWMLDWLS